MGTPGSTRNIRTVLDNSPSVLKHVLGYRIYGVPYAGFKILKVTFSVMADEVRNQKTPAGWIGREALIACPHISPDFKILHFLPMVLCEESRLTR